MQVVNRTLSTDGLTAKGLELVPLSVQFHFPRSMVSPFKKGNLQVRVMMSCEMTRKFGWNGTYPEISPYTGTGLGNDHGYIRHSFCHGNNIAAPPDSHPDISDIESFQIVVIVE